MFTLNIETTNDAFGDGVGRRFETARILREVIRSLEDDGNIRGKVRDVNGNAVGEWELTDD